MYKAILKNPIRVVPYGEMYLWYHVWAIADTLSPEFGQKKRVVDEIGLSRRSWLYWGC